jgi:hypothetical protein
MPPPKSQKNRQVRNRSGVERLLPRRAGERLPVERGGVHALPVIGITAQIILIPVTFGQGDLPEAPGLDHLFSEQEVVPTALLRARRHHAVGALDGPDQFVSFRQFVRDRLFAIDVLTRIYRIDGHRHVPVIGRADHHGIHIFPVQHTPVVRNGLGVPAKPLRGRCTARLVNIACRHDFNPRQLCQESAEIGAAASGPDHSHPNAIVGA